MVEKRRISWSLYITAFLISLVIFALGVYVGKVMDKKEIQTVAEDLSRLSKRLAVVQLLLLMEENSSFCPVYDSGLKSVEEEREKLGYVLSFLEEKRKINAPELKKEYFILEAQCYFLAKKLKKVCKDESVILLYFYSENCSDCIRQGTEILEARDELMAKNITMRIYSFDKDLESPVVSAFIEQFNISTYPSVVINHEVYEGFLPKERIVEISSR